MDNSKKIQDIIKIVKDRLVAVYAPNEIYLFGSYAWGNPDNDSDLDILVVIKDTAENRIHKRVLIGRKALVDLEIPKDIIVYTSLEFNKMAEEKASLCYKIKNEGVKLYETV